jgi:hypothetical protein
MTLLTNIDGAVIKPTLVDLIKSFSPHFEATIDKQEYLPTGPVAQIALAADGEMTYIRESHAEKVLDDEDRDSNEDSESLRKQQDSNTSGATIHVKSTLGLKPDEIDFPAIQRNVLTGKSPAQNYAFSIGGEMTHDMEKRRMLYKALIDAGSLDFLQAHPTPTKTENAHKNEESTSTREQQVCTTVVAKTLVRLVKVNEVVTVSGML